MNAFIRVAPVVIVLGSGMLAAAGEPSGDGPQCLLRACCSSPLLTGCPDDYCRKSMPGVACLPCGQPDDYCRKLLPRIGRLPCGEPDDYCRKPYPALVCPPVSPFLQCGQ